MFLGLPDPHPGSLVRDTDPRIRIRTKMSRVPNTVYQNVEVQTSALQDCKNPSSHPYTLCSTQVVEQCNECHLGPKKSRLSGPTPSNEMSNGFVPIKIIKTKRHIKNRNISNCITASRSVFINSQLQQEGGEKSPNLSLCARSLKNSYFFCPLLIFYLFFEASCPFPSVRQLCARAPLSINQATVRARAPSSQ